MNWERLMLLFITFKLHLCDNAIVSYVTLKFLHDIFITLKVVIVDRQSVNYGK